MTLDELFPNSKNNEHGKNFKILNFASPKRTTSNYNLLCLVCECEVQMRPDKVFAGQRSCKCGKLYYRNSGRRIERLEKVTSAKNIIVKEIPNDLKWHTYLDFQCKVCDHSWTTQENNIVNYGTGCPSCSGTLKLTPEDCEVRFTSLVNSKSIQSYEFSDYNWATGRVEVVCNSGHVRSCTPSGIYSKPESCVSCSKTGFNPNLPSFLYLLELKDFNNNTIGYKYGIAKDTEQRHSVISRGFTGNLCSWITWEYEDGFTAQKHEAVFKKAFPSLLTKAQMKDGWTETFDKNLLSSFLVIQNEQYKEQELGYFT